MMLLLEMSCLRVAPGLPSRRFIREMPKALDLTSWTSYLPLGKSSASETVRVPSAVSTVQVDSASSWLDLKMALVLGF